MTITVAPQLPSWVPPAGDLNGLADASVTKQEVAAPNTPLPVVYGRDKVQGKIGVVHVDDTAGFMYLAVLWCTVSDTIEKVYVDGVLTSHGTEGLVVKGGAVENHAAGGTSTLLSTAIAGYTDDLTACYTVLKIPKAYSRSFPRVEAIVKGKQLYDPRTGLTVWSDNPVLAARDIAVGSGWTVNETDVQTAANACDSPTIGGLKPRLVGLTLVQPRAPEEWMTVFRVYTGCFIGWEDGKIRFIPDKAVTLPGDRAASFTVDNIVEGTLTVKRKSPLDLPTVCVVEYRDATSDDAWRTDRAVYTEVGLPARVTRVSLPGIQRYSQAYREAYERIKKLQTDLVVGFRTDDAGLKLQVGAVVSIVHPIGLNGDYRVIGLAHEQGRWDLTAVPYDANVYSSANNSNPTTWVNPTLGTPSSAIYVAVVGSLTNEAHAVAADLNGLNYSLTGAGGTFKVWSTTNDVTGSGPAYTVVGGADNGANHEKTQNGITLSVNKTTGVYTLSGAAWTTSLETFTLQAVYAGVTVQRVYSISKSTAGQTGGSGAASKTISAYCDRQVITYNNLGAVSPTPQTANFGVVKQNTTAVPVWLMHRADGTALDASAYLSGTAVTNLLTYSQEFSDSSWVATRMTCPTPNTAVAPDGTLTADVLVEGTDANSTFYVYHNVTVSSAVAYFTTSVFLKAGTRAFARVQLSEATGGSTVSVYVNLSTGESLFGGTGANWADGSAQVTPCGDGWYRVSVTGQKTNAATIVRIIVQGAESLGDSTYTGTGLTLIAWGAEMKQGSTLTPYIPTTSAAVTGVQAESVSLTDGNFNTARGSTMGVIVTATAVDYGLLTDKVSLLKVQDGATGTAGLAGYLTNEAHTVVSNSAGNGYSLTGSGGTFKVFLGTAPVSATFSITGGTDAGTTWTKAQNGLTMTINETTGVYSLSGAESWTSDFETFELVATYSGQNITRTYSVAKSKSGLAVFNGGFETGSAMEGYQSGAASGVISTTSPYAGTYCLRIGSAAGGPNHITQMWPVSVGQVWNLSAMVKRDETALPTAAVYLQVRRYDAAKAALGSTSVANLAHTVSGWTAISGDYTVASGVAYIAIDVGESPGDGTGYWFADDLAAVLKGANGSPGTSAKSLLITATAQAFKYTSANVLIEPSSIVFTASQQGSSNTINWKTQYWNGSTWADTAVNRMSPTTGASSTLTETAFATEGKAMLRVYASFTDGSTYDDAITVNKLMDGAPAKLLTVISDRQNITYDGTGALSPSTQTTVFNAVKQNTTVVPTWLMERIDGTKLDASTYFTGGTAVTNLLQRSSAFTTSPWGLVNVSTGTAITAPDGSQDGMRLQATATAATTVSQTATATATSHTASVYLKQGNTAISKVVLRNDTGATNLVTATITWATLTVAGAGATMYEVGGGWVRVVLTATTNITIGNTLRVYVGFIGDSQTAGDYVYAWGAQLESGASATNHIPTLGAAVTGVIADSVSMTAANFNTARSTTTGLVITGSLADVGACRFDKISILAVSNGAPPLTMSLSRAVATIPCNSAGTPKSGAYDNAKGAVTVFYGATDVTASATLSSSTVGGNCTGAVNTATDTPKSGQAKGYYEVTVISADTAFMTITAVYNGQTISQRFSLSKAKDGSAAIQDGQFASLSVTQTSSYPTTGQLPSTGSIEIPVGPNGTITVVAGGEYVGSNSSGTITGYGKVQYREKGSGTWLDVSGGSATGSVAYWVTNDTYWEPGSFTISTTFAGPTSLKIYEFQLCMYKSGTGGNMEVGASLTVSWV